jgi:hypothetical protein
VSVTASAEDLERGYEALRAGALGAIPVVRPRGLAVLRRAGIAAWMRALPPAVPGRRRERSAPDGTTALAEPAGELVSILAEMALGARWGWRGAS